MKTIHFPGIQREQQFFEALRAEVDQYLKAHQLNRFGTPLYYFKAVLFFGLFLAAYAYLLFGAPGNGAIIAVYASMGVVGLLVAFNVAHDASHGCFLANKLWNDIIYHFTFNMLGTNAYLWRFRHNKSHHPFPNVDGCDADIDNNAVIRLSPHSKVRWFHKYQQWYAPLVYLIYTLHWVFYKDFHYLRRKKLANMENIRHSPKAVAGVILAKVLYFSYILGLPLLLHSDQTDAILLGFLVHHVVLSYFFLFTNIMNHYALGVDFPLPDDQSGRLPHSWAAHQLLTCQDFYPESKIFNFFFGGFNAHSAHHLFPHIAHIHYTAISPMIKRLAQKHGIPYHETTWFKGLKSHFQYLRQLGDPPLARGESQRQTW